MVNNENILFLVNSLFKEDTLLRIKDVAKFLEEPRIESFYQAMKYNPKAPWPDIFSKGQIQSKIWLIQTLKDIRAVDLGIVFLVGGWVGLLPKMMLEDEKLKIEKIRSFDIDPTCARTADLMNQNNLNGWRFKAQTADALHLNYEKCIYTTLKANGSSVQMQDVPDTIINTSCDHFDYKEWFSLIPKGRLVIMQNTDFAHDESHTNLVSSLEDFKKSVQFSHLIYVGEKQLPVSRRFMLIGYK